MDTLGRVASYIERNGLLPEGCRVCCALSGGPDSVALLHILLYLRERFGLRMSACHVEHGIRGEDSLADMEFVRALCTEMEVPLSIRHVDIPRISQESGKGLETVAREARRVFFGELLRGGVDRIALGHHLDDQAETVLMRLSRGARGAIGMQPAADGLIRPLLCLSRADIMEYLHEHGYAYRTDATNHIADNPRNHIRLNVLPELEKAYPGAAKALARAAEYMREDDDYLDRLAAEWLAGGQDKPPDRAVLRRAIAQTSRNAGYGERLTQPLMERLINLYQEGRTGERVEASGMLWERTKDGKVSLVIRESSPDAVMPLSVPGQTILGRYVFEARILEQWDDPLPDGRTEQVFDADRVPALHLRYRHPGDRMRPLGMRGSRKLQDILTDRGFPRALRDSVPLIAHEEEVYWMPGLPPDDRAKVTPETKRFLWIREYTKGEGCDE